jgi:transposase
MVKPLLPAALWERIRPFLPKRPPRPKGGRPPVPDRQALIGILFVLKSGIPWEDLPQEMGCGCGMTCWRRLQAWQRARVWHKVHTALLSELRSLDRLDFSRFLIDSSHVRAVGGGAQTGPSPVDRRKLGSKHHVLTDAQGVPVVIDVTPANTPDIVVLVSMVEMVPPIAGKPGAPRRRPERVQGDKAYDSEPDREQLRQRGIDPVLPKRRLPYERGLGVFRWFVERTLSWYHQLRRLRIRYDRRIDMHYAFYKLASIVIAFRFLTGFC